IRTNRSEGPRKRPFFSMASCRSRHHAGSAWRCASAAPRPRVSGRRAPRAGLPNAAAALSSTLPAGGPDHDTHLVPDDPKPPTRIGPLPRAILIAGGAFIACMLAQLISMQQPQALLVWPASGVAFAAGQRWGTQWALPAAVGAAIWSALYFEGPLLPLLAGVVTIAGPLLALGLLHRLERWKPAEYRLESAIRHIVAIVIVAAPVDAVLASIGASASGLASTVHPAHVFTYWWLIDSLGMLLVVPACAQPAATDTAPPRSSEIESVLDPGALTLTAMVV